MHLALQCRMQRLSMCPLQGQISMHHSQEIRLHSMHYFASVASQANEAVSGGGGAMDQMHYAHLRGPMSVFVMPGMQEM